MSSKKTYIATFWRKCPEMKNSGYYVKREFQSTSQKAAEKLAERRTKQMIFGTMDLISVELKQE